MKISIGGDVSIKDSYELFADGGKGKELFGNVVELFKESDNVIVNLECVVTERVTPIKKIGPNLKAPLNTIKTLKGIGVTDCVLSNNHIFDFGKAGIEDTLQELEKYGINHTGFGKNEQDARKNLIITDGKTRVCVIAVCEHEYSYALENRMGARAYDPYDTNDDIAEAKKENDFVIVIYHGGKEGCQYPSPRLLKACRSMVKHGADLVLCQHSHCIGCYEEYMGGYILYGQGNFHFVCKEYEGDDGGELWNKGLLVRLDIGEKLNVELIPCVVDGKSIRLASNVEREKLLNELENRSENLKNGKWRTLWREFALSQERYNIFSNEIREDVAHYFDCEAHTDVCKEIFETYNKTNET